MEAIRKATIRLPLIALYNSPKSTFLNTYSSKIGPTTEINIIKTGICLAIAINRSVLGLCCCCPKTSV